MSSTGGWKGRAVSDAVVATAVALVSEGDGTGAIMAGGVDRGVSERIERRGVGRGTSVTATVVVAAGNVATAGAALPDSTDGSAGAGLGAGETTPAATCRLSADDGERENGPTTNTAATAIEAANAAPPPIQRRPEAVGDAAAIACVDAEDVTTPTAPSAASSRNASRTGVRERPREVARVCSRSQVPGPRSPDPICSRSAS